MIVDEEKHRALIQSGWSGITDERYTMFDRNNPSWRVTLISVRSGEDVDWLTRLTRGGDERGVRVFPNRDVLEVADIARKALKARRFSDA